MKSRKKLKRRQVKVDLRFYKNLSEADDYNKRLEEQNGGCAICHRPPKKVRLSRDHNHATGKVRGLLCLICNRKVLGVIEKYRIIPEAIIKYLEKFDPSNPLLVREYEEKKKQ